MHAQQATTPSHAKPLLDAVHMQLQEFWRGLCHYVTTAQLLKPALLDMAYTKAMIGLSMKQMEQIA